MSARDLSVFRTSRTDLIALHTQWVDEQKSWNAKLHAFKKKHRPSKKHTDLYTIDSFSGRHIAGFGAQPEDYREPPEGWKVDRKRGLLTPLKKTAKGKAIAAAMEAVVLRDFRRDLEGLPNGPVMRATDAGMALLHPGIELHGETIYCVWGTNEPPEMDADIWESVKLSEYYAAVEADEAVAS